MNKANTTTANQSIFVERNSYKSPKQVYFHDQRTLFCSAFLRYLIWAKVWIAGSSSYAGNWRAAITMLSLNQKIWSLRVFRYSTPLVPMITLHGQRGKYFWCNVHLSSSFLEEIWWIYHHENVGYRDNNSAVIRSYKPGRGPLMAV